MTPASNLDSRDSDPMNGGWLVFGKLMAESLQLSTRPDSLHPKEARALCLAGRLRRLLAWWSRPLPAVTDKSATDAATRLEILTRGGFQR